MNSYRYNPSLGSRISAILMSLAIVAIIILMLIRMGLLPPLSGKPAERLTAIDLQRESPDNSPHKSTKAAEKQVQHAAAPVQPAAQVQPHPQVKPETVPPLQLLKLSKDEFAAADISKMGKHPAPSGDNITGAKSASTYGPGEGPGGSHLFRAEWYREPSDAEMVTYMPHRDVAGGWAEIACKTIEHFHVEDCRELGESPPGSGLSRALRQAAWQFLVRPPNVDGKPLVGSWVRIHFDFTRARVRDEPERGDPAAGAAGDGN